MNPIKTGTMLVALVLVVPLLAFGQDVSLTSDGKVPGQPFVALQQQIDELRVELMALQIKTGDLEGADLNLQSQINGLQAQIDQLQAALDNLNLIPMAGTVCPPGEAVTGFNGDGTIQCSLLGGGGEIPPDTLYDDFSSEILDPAKWDTNVGDGCTLVHSYLGEYLRVIHDLNGISSNCGVSFKNGAPVAAFSTDVKVQQFNYVSGNVRARVLGSFFNTFNPNPVQGDLTGDILAMINLKPDNLNPGSLFFQWVVVVCNNSSCSSTIPIGAGGLSGYVLGETRTMGLRYDGQTAFTFEVDGVSPLTFDVANQSWGKMGPAGVPLRQIRTRGTGTPHANLDVLFDNVHCETQSGDPCPYP